MSPTTGNRNMAAQTGSTYIYGTMIDNIEIPTAKRGFSTVTSSNEVSATTTDNRKCQYGHPRRQY